MCLEEYRAYLSGLSLTDNEINELIEALTSLATNIVDNLFVELSTHDGHN